MYARAQELKSLARIAPEGSRRGGSLYEGLLCSGEAGEGRNNHFGKPSRLLSHLHGEIVKSGGCWCRCVGMA